MSSYSEGQVHQLMEALEQKGKFTSEDLTKLGQCQKLDQIKLVINDQAMITVIKHVIDCDADPFIHEGWNVEEHRKGGQLEFDASKVKLFLSKKQKDGKSVQGHDLRKELRGKPVLNANVLDYLLAHPEIIPEERKSKCVFFWGTIYRDSDGGLCVRCLYWRGDQWRWGAHWLDLGFDDRHPAALLGK